MEVAALFPIAAEYQDPRAGHLQGLGPDPKGTHLSAEERQTTFDAKISVALEVAHEESAESLTP